MPARTRGAQGPSARAQLDAMSRSEWMQRLDAIPPPFDPLDVLSWTRQERAHTRFLAWLLDPAPRQPGGEHGLGARTLHALVARALAMVEALPGADASILPTHLRAIDAATLSVTRELAIGDGVRTPARAPDLRCTWRDTHGDTWLVLIENKIDASEGDGQVKEYLAWGARHHPHAHRMLLYVTPDGHGPNTDPRSAEVVVSMTWNDVAEVCLDVIAHSAPSPAHTAARTFAATTLEALRARFGGRDDTRALVEALYDAFPRAAALVASPASDETHVAPIRARHSNAVWHLRTLRPRAQRWTRSWADRVADFFAALDTTAPRLVACAPHLGAPDMASWSIAGITEALSLHAFCTSGAVFGGHRARAWIALRAPNLDARGVFKAREQCATLDALPEATRTWLQNATPVHDVPGVWRWLCVGTPVTLARGFSFDDDARRTARALYEQLSPHLDALRVGFGDPSLRLYSCDLDPDHLLPHDLRDREALALEAHADAERVCIITRAPTRHPYELRRACALGAALGAAFGATRTLVYDYAPVASRAPMHPTIVVLSLDVFRAPDDASLEASVATVFEALARGAMLVLIDARHDTTMARRHLGVLLDAPAEATAWRAGATRVVRALDAPWANAARPEQVARWWQSLVARAAAV